MVMIADKNLLVETKDLWNPMVVVVAEKNLLVETWASWDPFVLKKVVLHAERKTSQSSSVMKDVARVDLLWKGREFAVEPPPPVSDLVASFSVLPLADEETLPFYLQRQLGDCF